MSGIKYYDNIKPGIKRTTTKGEACIPLFLVKSNGAGADQGKVIRVDRTEAVPEPSSILGLLAFGALGGTTWSKCKRKQFAGKVKTC